MTKKYVYVKSSYEYNDERHTKGEGGVPLKIYTDEAKADKAALKANIKELKDIEIGSYCECLSDILSKSCIAKLQTEYQFDTEDAETFAGLPDEALEMIINDGGPYSGDCFRFYEVYEVEE